MSQHDMNIANQGFPAFRADLNSALDALVTNSSGATAPSTTFAHQFWVDTAANPSILKVRNADNDAWIVIGEIDQTGDAFVLTSDAEISGGTIDDTPIGASTPSTGVFTDLTASGDILLGGYPFSESNMAGRNLIINGAFQVWQRGTSQTTSGYGSADRWSNSHSGSTKTTSQQAFDTDQTTVPGNPKNFLRTVVSTASSSSSYAQAIQKIEDLQQFSGETVTLSFWAKADAAKNIAVELRETEDDGSGSLSHHFTAALTTSWQKFTITQTITAISTSVTLGANSNLGVVFWFDAGTDFSSVNPITGNQSGTFDIAQVQLEAGSAATPFERRSYGQELALCQRYYNKSYSTNVVPGTSTNAGQYRSISSGGATFINFDFPVEMRAAPTITPYSNTGTSGVYSSSIGNWSPSGTEISTRRYNAYGTLTSGYFVFGHYVASSEL